MKVQEPPLRQEMSQGVLVGCSSWDRMVSVLINRLESDFEEVLDMMGDNDNAWSDLLLFTWSGADDVLVDEIDGSYLLCYHSYAITEMNVQKN